MLNYKKVFFNFSFYTMTEPKVTKIINERGEISDELDYAISKFIISERGAGFTACCPQLIEIEDGSQAIKMGLDNTFIGKDGNIFGLGIVGYLYISIKDFSIIYCTPLNEMEENVKVLKDTKVEAKVRPKGKY